MRRLRTQMLIAMGLPACWTGPTPAPPVTPAGPAKPQVSTVFDPSLCPKDSVPETVCGQHRETVRTCGTKGSYLQSVDEQKLYVTAENDDDPANYFRDFRYDREETKRYREGMEDQEAAPGYCCYSQCTPMTVGVADPVVQTPNSGYYIDTKCIPAPPGGTSKPSKEDAACAIGVAFEGTLRPYSSTESGECCYSLPMRAIRAIPGRALRIDGQPCVAEVDAREGWGFAIEPSLEIDDATRARLAAAWLDIAQLEHASIAAFGSLALRLVAAGAPLGLIEQAHRAALDEIEHARIAFELASVYGGHRVGPGRFDAALRAVAGGSLRELAIETFVDGCINETTAAHQAEIAASGARDPHVAAALARIADDETRHAQLAWAVVAWCVRTDVIAVDELRRFVMTADAAPRNEDLLAFGVLGDAAGAAAREHVIRAVVLPCLDALAA